MLSVKGRSYYMINVLLVNVRHAKDLHTDTDDEKYVNRQKSVWMETTVVELL